MSVPQRWWSLAGRVVAAIAAVVVMVATAAGQNAPAPTAIVNPWASALENIRSIGLPRLPGDVPVYHSPSARAEAVRQAEVVADAAAWFSAELGWRGPLAVAVLDAGDYARVTMTPYPTPFAQRGGNLIVLPDDISAYPGFATWDIAAADIASALAVHELGHLVAGQLGVRPAARWVDELVANLFLAAYSGARRPGLDGMLAGVPPRFGDAVRYRRLVELEAAYGGMSQENYAWFQFRLAALARHVAQGRRLADILDRFRAEFPAGGGEIVLPSADLEKLERIAPGVAALAAGLADEASIPQAVAGSCDAEPGPEGDVALIVENRSGGMLRITDPVLARMSLDLDLRGGPVELPEAEVAARLEAELPAALADGRYARLRVPAGGVRIRRIDGNARLHLAGGGCLVVPPGATSLRFVWTATP